MGKKSRQKIIHDSRVRIFVAPDRCSERFADTKANGHGGAHDQHDDQDFDHDSVASAKALHTRAGAVLLAVFGSLFPVALVGPDLAILLACQNHARPWLVDGAMCPCCFDVCFERIAVLGSRSCAAR